jgi:hypothetical protein
MPATEVGVSSGSAAYGQEVRRKGSPALQDGTPSTRRRRDRPSASLNGSLLIAFRHGLGLHSIQSRLG